MRVGSGPRRLPRLLVLLLAPSVVFGLAGCKTTTTERRDLPPLPTVERVELERYVGTWYEIASIPQKFQKGCTATRATYSLRDDGDIDVVNQCRKGSLTGEEKVVEGKARVVDRATNSKLEVNFFGPFWGEYWIIELGDDYEYSVVGHPSRDYLWILSRTPSMAPERYEAIVRRLTTLGYDTHRLQRTQQPDAAPPS